VPGLVSDFTVLMHQCIMAMAVCEKVLSNMEGPFSEGASEDETGISMEV